MVVMPRACDPKRDMISARVAALWGLAVCDMDLGYDPGRDHGCWCELRQHLPSTQHDLSNSFAGDGAPPEGAG